MSTCTNKNNILKYHKENPLLKNKEIAKYFNVSPQYISKILKETIKNEKNNLEEEVSRLFFNEKYSITEISNFLNVSIPTVRKILKDDETKFTLEKNNRKKINQEERKRKRKLANASEDKEIFANLKHLQEVTALQDSRNSKISDIQMINLNRQHYTFNKKKTSLELTIKDCAIPDGIPKKYSIKSNYNTYQSTYSNGIDGRSIENVL